ncbi:MAG TPA: DUF1501 domain-containing protein [Chthoniobacterales bacterium]
MNLESTFSLQSRRQFLRRIGLGAAATWTLPIFIERTFGTLEASASDVTQAVTGKDAPILVILQLAGGNDGLNTVVPFADDAYYRDRPKIGVPANTVLRLNDHVGLNPRMTGLKSLYDEGLLAIVQGVGYPNPNRSHFRATEIWQTASDSEKTINKGWIGRFFDNCCRDAAPTVGVTLTREIPQVFAAQTPTGVALAANPDLGKRRSMRDLEEDILMGGGSGGSIDMLGSSSRSELSPLEYLQRTTLDAQVSQDKIADILSRIPSSSAFPKTQLGQQFSLISRLIAGKLPTRIYYLSQGGFDTHNNQVPSHSRLVADFSDAVTTFVREMQSQGNYSRVMLMTFSEFGRRVRENESGGTDHGTAAPMFLVGGALKPGLHGNHPSLTKLDDGDLIHTVDFRTVYATLLDKWLEADSAKVLGAKFQHLGFV